MHAMRPDRTNDRPKLIEALLRPSAYPHPVSGMELLETHISWVILTGPFAYKIKKPLKLEFLDFSTLERRRWYCEEELRLNRQWAPELYLDVVAIRGSEEHPVIGGDGDVIDYAVKMAQFPQSARLDAQLEAGLLDSADMCELAETLAERHGRACQHGRKSAEQALERVSAPMLENFPHLVPHIDEGDLQRLQAWTEDKLQELEGALIRRQAEGFVRECHGDLHLGNLVRLPSGITPFDCVEFSRELRTIDVLSDVAFLAMDLVARARPDLAYAFLNRYLECTGDYAGMAVFGLYYVYHCMIRAKVAAIRCTERAEASDRARDRQDVQHYSAVALDWADRPPPRLVLMHGYSASGKTWLSSRLMQRLPAIRVRSDVERKRLFDLGEKESSGSGIAQGIYSDEAGVRVYARLLELAERLLRVGFTVIVDAAFLKRGDRKPFPKLAERLYVPLVLVHASAGKAELERRLVRRGATGNEVSEADAAVLKFQHGHAEPLDAAEQRRTVLVATDEHVDFDEVVERIRRLSAYT